MRKAANIYFSYGMTKSGSTLGFELARTALEQAGCRQPLLPGSLSRAKRINFIAHIDVPAFASIETFANQLGGPLAIKTHTRPDEPIIDALQSGRAFAHAIYRDPRDIALSMLDHGKRARRDGKPAFSEFVEIADTIEPIKHQANTLLAWLSLPNVKPLFYDDIAFATAQTLPGLMDDLNIQTDAAQVINTVQNDRFTQFNIGRPNRHEREMDTATSARFCDIFAPMYDRLITNKPTQRPNGDPILDPSQSLCHWDKQLDPIHSGANR
jgi:hypothetical protein